jgi:predicted DsbA family dithiol-disulfide isomerase
VKEELGDELEITWRSFALEQVNSKEGDGWKAWEQGPDYESRGLLALCAGEASKSQGNKLHNVFFMKLLEARHVDRKDVRERDVILEIARDSGLDMGSFEKELDDPETLKKVGADHERAAELGIFGTPTFVFADSPPTFVKTYTPPKTEAVAAFRHFIALSRDSKLFGEIKRPQPPWPRGVFEDDK